MAWVAAWLGWTLDAFDFTIFLLIMVPISQTFDVPLVAVTAVFTVTLWLRLAGATASGWLADRIGRKTPLMISIAWYSCATSFPASRRPSGSCSCSARCWASAWAQSGRLAPLAMEFMAGALARFHERHSPGLVVSWLPAVQRRLRVAVRQHRLAWFAVDRHPPALAVSLCPPLREEPEVWVENRRQQREQDKRVPRAAVRHLPSARACATPSPRALDGQQLHCGLFVIRAVRHASAEGPTFDPAMVALPIALANARGFRFERFWLGRGPCRTADGR